MYLFILSAILSWTHEVLEFQIWILIINDELIMHILNHILLMDNNDFPLNYSFIIESVAHSSC